jgi:hypothetical protein
MPDDMRDIDPRRLVIRRQQHMARLAEIERAMRVGATPAPETMRGAEPVTIRAPLPDASTGIERMQRAAAYQQPLDHEEAPKIDQLFAIGELTPRQYQNACAALNLMRTVQRSKGIGEWLRDLGHTSGEEAGPQDYWNDLIETGGVGMQAVCMLLRDEPMGLYMFNRARAHLDTMDALALEWAGERWPREDRK